jgi:hypothetical protein
MKIIGAALKAGYKQYTAAGEFFFNKYIITHLRIPIKFYYPYDSQHVTSCCTHITKHLSHMEFPTEAKVRLSITSTQNAAFSQRLFIERRIDDVAGNPFYEMGDYEYHGEIQNPIKFKASDHLCTWRIIGQNDGGDGGWKSSRQRISGIGTPQIVVSHDDDNSGDDDFNDLIVTVSLIANNDPSAKPGFYDDFDNTALDSNGKIAIEKPLPDLDEHGHPIMPH